MIEADLQRHYRVDLCDLWRGRISVRRLEVLIDELPADCRTARVLAGETGPLSYWSLQDTLVGFLADEVSRLRWEWGHAHIDEKKRKDYRKPPKSVLPIEEPEKEVRVISPSQLGQFLETGQTWEPYSPANEGGTE